MFFSNKRRIFSWKVGVCAWCGTVCCCLQSKREKHRNVLKWRGVPCTALCARGDLVEQIFNFVRAVPTKRKVRGCWLCFHCSAVHEKGSPQTWATSATDGYQFLWSSWRERHCLLLLAKGFQLFGRYLLAVHFVSHNRGFYSVLLKSGVTSCSCVLAWDVRII